MRKTHFPAILAMAVSLALAATMTVAAEEDAATYGRLLETAETVADKSPLATTLASLNDPSAGQYVFEALDWAVRSRSSIHAGSELESYERFVRTLVKCLGDWNYAGSASLVMRAYDDSADPLTKAEALMALGSLRADEYAGKIAIILRDLNHEPSEDARAGEKIAYGCVVALERLRSPVGYAPVFFASEGWYSKYVRDQAERSLPLILDDPSGAIEAIIAEGSVSDSIRALALELRSNAPASGKLSVAARALSRGLVGQPRGATERTEFSQLRSGALSAIVSLGGTNGAAVRDFVAAYRVGTTDERLLVLKALGQDKTAAAASALSDIILDLNAAQLSGIVDETRNKLTSAAIQNAALNGSKELLHAVEAVHVNQGWSGSVLALAAEALKALQ